jgi:hypothetical protein
MAEEQKQSQLQKILILPPMKGLNLYDNPFTMDPQFAVDLVNFMPPTTVLSVRPGVEVVASFDGAIKGIYAYSIGATKKYGTHWYEQTITEGENHTLLLKVSRSEENNIIWSLNPHSGEKNRIVSTHDQLYSKDYTAFKHALFFCFPGQSSPMYIYTIKKGWKEMVWNSPDGRKITGNAGDLENITYYNGYLFANGYKTFDIFFIDEKEVDPADATKWSDWLTFRPKVTQTISLDGIATKGGSIMKMFQFTRSGLDTVDAYLCVCTTEGEIILFSGTPAIGATSDAEATWKATGKYNIPVPLNKNCFCEMEGDMIIATKNGLVSLMRVVFGKTSEITTSIETRISNIFTDYMFTMNEFNQFIGLYYNYKNRLLIFNIPTSMPIALSDIKRGYTFTKEQSLIFLNDNPIAYDNMQERLKKFVYEYLYSNQIDYTVYIAFNNNFFNGEGIYFDCKTEVQKDSTPDAVHVITTMRAWIFLTHDNPDKREGAPKKVSFKKDFICSSNGTPGIIFEAPNISDYSTLEITNLNDCKYDDDFQIWDDNKKNSYYGYNFPDNGKPVDEAETYTITEITPRVRVFSTSHKKLLCECKTGELINSVDELRFENKFNVPGLKGDIRPASTILSQYLKTCVWSKANRFEYNSSFGHGDRPNIYVDNNSMYESPVWQTYGVLWDNFDDTKKKHHDIAQAFYDHLKGRGSDLFVYTMHYVLAPQNNPVDERDISISILVFLGYDKDGPDGKKEIINDCHIRYNYLKADGLEWTSAFSWHTLHDNGRLYLHKAELQNGFLNMPEIILDMKNGNHSGNWIVKRIYSSTDGSTIDKNLFQYYTAPNTLLHAPDGVFPTYTQVTTDVDVTLRQQWYGWLFSCFYFYTAPSSQSSSPITLNTLGDDEHDFGIQSENWDLSFIPLLSNLNILAPYRSTQYVMNSYYGTWSQWKNINMLDGIDFQNEFFLIIPQDFTKGKEGYISNKSLICKFNSQEDGDFSDVQNPDLTYGKPIHVSYKTAASTFETNQMKQMLKIKIFATKSTFWGNCANNLTITMWSDFEENPYQKYLHQQNAMDDLRKFGLSEMITAEKLENPLNITYQERKMLNSIYIEASSLISNGEMALLCKPANRIALEVSMDIKEHNIVIYGYELYFKLLNKL